MQSFQVVNGRLDEHMSEACLGHAMRAFLQREQIDTNPRTVQTVVDGTPIGHWYYRSDEYVDQPYFIAQVQEDLV